MQQQLGRRYSPNIPQRVGEIVDQCELGQLTENTISDPEELMDELEIVRDRGVADNDQELVSGLRAVGVPISRELDEVHGALSITEPTD